MINVTFTKTKAVEILNLLRRAARIDLGNQPPFDALLTLLGAAVYIAKSKLVECPGCGFKGDNHELVEEFLSKTTSLSKSLKLQLKRTTLRIPKEHIAIAIEFYAHLCELVDTNEYDQDYGETVLSGILIGWHSSDCEGGSHDPEDPGFQGCYPGNIHVVFHSGVKGVEPSLPADPAWQYEMPVF